MSKKGDWDLKKPVWLTGTLACSPFSAKLTATRGGGGPEMEYKADIHFPGGNNERKERGYEFS
jgi:hypothetical protein